MVVGRLLHEESRRRQFANESVETAMFSGGSSGKKSKWSKGEAKKSSGGNERGKGNASNGSSKCHYCRKAGHFWRECRKRPRDWTPLKARNQEGNAHTASGEADGSMESLVLLAGDGINTSNDAWFLDTDATQHMMHSASFLDNIGAPGDVKRVVFGNDKSLPVVGVGSTRLIVDSGPVDITNVLHVSGLKVNLLSVTQLAKKDVKVTIDGAKMNLFWKGKQFAQGVLNGQLYQLKTHQNTASSNVAQGSKATLKMWHNRLAHANYDSVKELANKGLAKGFDVIAGNDGKGVCAACVKGKMARKPFGSRTSPLAKDPLALVHMDVCGPMRHASKGGARFLLVILDNATRMCWTRLLKAKGDAAKAIQEWALDLQPKARAAIYLGIAANERAWRVWDSDEKRVVTSRDVIFDEAKFPTTEKQTPQLTVVLPAREEDEAVEVPPHVEKGAVSGGGENEECDDDVEEVPPTEEATSSAPSSLPLALTRGRRTPRPNTRLTDYATVAVGEFDEESAALCLATIGDDNPRTHKEAFASPDAPLWKQAMERELASIKENDVFELVDPPKGAYLVGCK
ncbi:unnamed protein product [Closterium sp. NIES-65]|nr:unnamed protein product [Closterium sp. NIES-65]